MRAKLAAGAMCLVFGNALGAPSFDCAKAESRIEKLICSTPTLSQLDVELGKTYGVAHAIGGDDVLRSQRAWIEKVRNACDNGAFKEGEYIECLQLAYLVRIETLRTDDRFRDKLFVRKPAPSVVFGRYSELDDDCVVSGPAKCESCEPETVCRGKAESYVQIDKGAGNAVNVKLELSFFNGHKCSMEGVGEWVDGVLRLPDGLGGETACVLLLKFEHGILIAADPMNSCKQNNCGVRGGFIGLRLPKDGSRPKH
jgi:uncharacterized protein